MGDVHMMARPRLLVVDDDAVARKIIAKIGAQAGFDIVEAGTLLHADAALRNQKFDCITLDLLLDTDSGALLVNSLVNSGNRIPLIVISGAEDYFLQTTLRIAQFHELDCHVLHKPLNMLELRRILIGKAKHALAGHLNAPLPAAS